MRKRFRWVWARRWRRWTAVGAGLFLLASIGGVEATSTSSFCGSCHIMEPYYASWKHSTHKGVACIKCHVPPGAEGFIEAKLNGLGQVVDDWLNRTSTKPSASVSQLSCTRSGCHTVETLNAKEVDNGVFKFKHAKHLGAHHLGVEISCGTCHSHVKGDEHFEVNTSVCITCHVLQREPAASVTTLAADPGPPANGSAISNAALPIRMAVRDSRPIAKGGSVPADPHAPGDKIPPSNCLACHDPPEGTFDYNGLKIDHAEFIGYGASCESCHRGATAPPPPIEDGACLQCHTWGVERSLPAREMHQVHTLGKHKIECFSCHGTIRHGTDAQAMSFQQFDCRQCHIDQHAVQRRAYLASGDIPGHTAITAAAVNPMFLAHVDCSGCHVSATELDIRPGSGARVVRATPEACDACHQAGLGAQMIPLWQDATKKLFAQASDELEALRPSVAATSKVHFDEAESLLNLVRIDGSWGVHNPKYTQRLIEQAREKLKAARAQKEGAGGS